MESKVSEQKRNKEEVCLYLSVLPVQLSVFLLHSGEVLLGLVELRLSGLDLLILSGHLQ